MLPQRVWFLRRFGLEMLCEGTTGVHEDVFVILIRRWKCEFKIFRLRLNVSNSAFIDSAFIDHHHQFLFRIIAS